MTKEELLMQTLGIAQADFEADADKKADNMVSRIADIEDALIEIAEIISE